MLQCVASVLQRNSSASDSQRSRTRHVCCSVLQRVAACCSRIRAHLILKRHVRGMYVAVCCSVLQCVAMCCSVLQCVAAELGRI